LTRIDDELLVRQVLKRKRPSTATVTGKEVVARQCRHHRLIEQRIINKVLLITKWTTEKANIELVIAQALDGIFTYLGIRTFGLSEGNPLIAYSFRHAGVGPGLTGAKLLAVGCSMLLHLLGLHRTLGVLTLLYLSLAILPWSYLIFLAR